MAALLVRLSLASLLFNKKRLLQPPSMMAMAKVITSSPTTARIPMSAGRPFTVSPILLLPNSKKKPASSSFAHDLPILAPFRVFRGRSFSGGGGGGIVFEFDDDINMEAERDKLLCNERLPGLDEGVVACFKRRADEEAFYCDLDVRGFGMVKVKVNTESRDVTVEAERGEGRKREAVIHVLRFSKVEVRGYYELLLEETKAERKKDGVLALTFPRAKNPAGFSSSPPLPASALASPIFTDDEDPPGSDLRLKTTGDEEAVYVHFDVRRFSTVQARLIAEDSEVVVVAEKIVSNDMVKRVANKEVCVRKVEHVLFMPEKVSAEAKNGVLTITLPRLKTN